MARKILLADDSVTAQNMGRKILTDAGYEVVTVNNGSAALKKIAEHKPDLIVLDVYMPGYSGLEVCQRVKENKETARIPILLTVGKLEPFKPEEARRARADAFVVKPFEASELLAALTKLEDKIVPQPEPYRQGRFAKAVAAVDPEDETGEKFGDKDAGWKDRLRIPTGPFQLRAVEAEAASERPLPADLPPDITPEEIAAITAAAAQLNGAPAGLPAEAAKTPTAEAQAPTEESAPMTFASSPDLQAPQAETAREANVGDVTTAATAGFGNATAEAASAENVVFGTATIEGSPALAEMQTAPEARAQAEEPKSEPSRIESVQPEIATNLEAVPAEMDPATVGPGVSRADATSAPPADEELMAALQSLMPAGGNGAAYVAPVSGNHNDLPAGVAAVDTVILGAHSVGPRWVAEAVALAGDETTRSLEKEMEQAYAAVAAGQAVLASVAVRGPQANAVARMVEVPAEVAALAQISEAPAVYAMASAAGAGEAGPVVAGVLPPTHEIPAPSHEETNGSGDSVSSGPQAAAESEAAIAASAAVLPDTMAAQIAGGAEDMVANWKNIRDSIADAAPKAAPVKEEVQEAEPLRPEAEPPSVAAAETTPHSGGASDPKAIASIVDSVLAELRPRIVEEIARKLAEPKEG